MTPTTNVGVQTTGFTDQCADVSDRWTSPDGPDALPRVVAGTVPRGRICRSTDFKYIVAWGPYRDCRRRQVG